ncbi:MAG: hypothetical protein GX361_00495 [Bacteroidales bacterium]|nr:hypothetical protein [Bacteroidales bacterium]
MIQTQPEKRAAGNTGFALGGVTCKLVALCFYSSVVQVDSFVLRNPPLRQAANRYILLTSQYKINRSTLQYQNKFLTLHLAGADL